MPTSDSLEVFPDRTARGKPPRLAAFATFFKSYMSVAAVVLACIPIPIASWRLLPIFTQQKGFLTVYSSLFCFLLVAFIFSIRHSLAKQMFWGGKWGRTISTLPFVFIGATLACILAYHATLQESIQQLRQLGAAATTSLLLENTDYTEIPRSLALAGYYLGIFVFAEAAFCTYGAPGISAGCARP